ncbi:hypothetical protein [Streptomyces sp. NRRL F-5053]|nr:hypothetical protein [Streptomyces sp. NRRL F-5053]
MHQINSDQVRWCVKSHLQWRLSETCVVVPAELLARFAPKE